MKVYIIKNEDLDHLQTLIDRDPNWGEAGSSSTVLTKEEQAAHKRAHDWFHYQINVWIAGVTR
jgi:hypothetical protein